MYSLRILFDAVGQLRIALWNVKIKNTEGVVCFIFGGSHSTLQKGFCRTESECCHSPL
jgi:hypothetical protein